MDCFVGLAHAASEIAQDAHRDTSQLLFLGLGVLFAALQALSLVILNWVRGEVRDLKDALLRGGDRMRGHEDRLSDHDSRLRLLERDHDRNHPPFVRRTDPPDLDPTQHRCHGGERQP